MAENTKNENHGLLTEKKKAAERRLFLGRILLEPQPRPQGLLLCDFQNGGSLREDPGQRWVTWYKISKKSWRFLSRDILRKTKTKWRRSIAWEAKHRSKNALSLYTRQWWLRSKMKYFYGRFNSGAGLLRYKGTCTKIQKSISIQRCEHL